MSIICSDVSFTYFEDRKEVLTNITAEFRQDRITVLTGASGCGKSTLLYLLAGVYPHNAGILKSGTISVEDVVPDSLLPKDRCRLIGMMFQNPDLQFCMDTVRHELAFCLENICCPPGDMDRKMDEALAFVGISHLKDRTLLSLSGGEKQKVMLSCLVMLEPKWLLLDEPFANIDDASARDISSKIKTLHTEKGMGILAIDHHLDHWESIADDIRILRDGQLLDLVLDGHHLNNALLEENGVIAPGVAYPVGVRAADGARHEEVLRIENLSMGYGSIGSSHSASGKPSHSTVDVDGSTLVLRELNATFCAGETYAIVGSSGSGKSSLFHTLSGLYPYTGTITLNGKPYRPNKKKELGQIGFVTQNPQDQFIGDTVKDEILISVKHSGKKAKGTDVADAEKKCEEILRSIKLWRYRDISAYMLSQGQQRRLGVAALLAYNCRVLLCDEPTYAQDRANTIAIMEGLCAQAREHGIVLIFSTHDPMLAASYADHIYELKEGQLYEKH